MPKGNAMESPFNRQSSLKLKNQREEAERLQRLEPSMLFLIATSPRQGRQNIMSLELQALGPRNQVSFKGKPNQTRYPTQEDTQVFKFWVFLFPTIVVNYVNFTHKPACRVVGRTTKRILEKAEHNPAGTHESQETNFQTLWKIKMLGNLLNGHGETLPVVESKMRIPNQLISRRFQKLH